MLVERRIGCVSIDVEIREANEVYLDQKYARYIEESGISGILNAIYNINKKDHMPLSAFIELTSYCNFSCPFCYINETNYPHHQLPPFHELKKTLDSLIDLGLLYCVLSGGECLLHPDFMKIYRYLKEAGVLVTVFTNGYLLDEKIFELFAEYKPFKVEVSLYGKDDQSYRITTEAESVKADRVFDNVLRLKNLGINVVCKTPITRLTEACYEDIALWCSNHDISYYTGAELMNTYSGIERDNYLATDLVRDRVKKESIASFFSDQTMMAISYTEKKKKISFDCVAGRTDVFIDSHYNIMPCMKAMWIPEWQYSIYSLGIYTAYKLMVDRINKLKRVPLQYCAGCEHHQVCQECYMTQYDYVDLRNHRTGYCKTLREFMQIPSQI